MLGYPTIEAMLRDMPDIVRIVRNSAGEDVVNAVVDENTAHLASLVARQKPSKTVSKVKMLKRRPPKVPYGRKVQNSPYLPRMNHQNYNYKFYSNFPQFEYNYHNKNTSLVKRFDHQPSVPPPPPPPPPPLQRKVQIARKPIRNLPPRFLRAQRISSSSSSLSSSPPVLSIENFTDVCTPESEIAANNWVDDVACLQSVISEENVSNCDIIRSYAASKGLIATFRNLPLNTRELPYTYISMLVIDGQKFNSYPNDKPTIDEAEEEAARVAVESLDLRPGKSVCTKTTRYVQIQKLPLNRETLIITIF
ncbi:uncharacterized protein LOC111623331 [Centruroides sculpturatus]|uniref:uncharacterized protein LOC111623331 n=1 Tax=Centruroides sculpturatus TaxID=218467 RepID=UPI000C6E72A7|nr:uncharacterized protein LOC111623331 [Centruroides sculpturatus]